MKLCRCLVDGRPSHGIIEGDRIALLNEPPYERIVRSGRVVALAETTLLAPCEPTKIVGVGLNYRAHALEMKKQMPSRPLLFLKPPSALLDPGGTILLPYQSNEVHHEAELAVVIGRQAKRVSPGDAPSYVLGYACFNDVTARDIQRLEVQYTRAKSFDTFAPLGPHIETDLDPRRLRVEASVNGALRQQGNTSDMFFDVFHLVAFASRAMTLQPGDVIATGTPPGVGPIFPGDVVEISVEGVGRLVNAVGRDVEQPATAS